MASIPPAVWVSVPTPLPSPSSIASSYGPNIFSLLPRRLKSRRAISASSSEDGASAGEIEISDRVRLAFSKANAYRKENTSSPQALVNAKKPFMDPAIEVRGSGGSEPEVPIAVNLNMEKSRENKKNREVSVEEPRDPGVEEKSLRGSRKGPVDSKLDKKAVLKISSKDFLGLDFSEKESHRRRPPGLVPLVGPLVEGDVQEVEIIVGDASKFEKTPRASTSFEVVDNTVLYKPKVSTWGVFPRPNNISKTFGGGRTFVPGEMLETLETKKAKEKCSRELIYAYKRKMGLVVDAKARAECEKALKEGDSLMDQGQLRGALPYYEKVMKLLVFQSDLHGLAALQWSICLDSLSRPNEARFMYEKLKSHPNAEVSKKARQFVFSFQAMEMMKVKNTNVPIKTGYEDYFEALVNNQVSYTPSIEEQNERVLEQVFPYIVFLLSPMLIILYVIVKKSL
ncbi:uncharacterized protein LOC110032349 isoform X1 [Phalaenopsis equestris]|uniref:uncharacterized protein LOC110032349 isoform X1 n=1 Tax=Phalaenopsis equestris TaxID=78828 RepID=UPI0009E4013E|nr:uncharacterized protein LOC110032349 isoform X1 [Phalaenopsis equestris]